jgi:general secretion pathway protein M
MKARWQALSVREQRSVSALGVLLGMLLFWSIAIAPALNTLRDSDNRRAQISQEQAHMLSLQTQAKALQNRTALSRDEALRNLQSLTPGAQIQLNVQGDRVTAQLKGVQATALANWLAQARNQAQALPMEAHLTRGNATGAIVTWDGNMVLTLPNRGAAP